MKRMILAVAALALIVAACGGGHASDDGGTSTTSTPAPTTTQDAAAPAPSTTANGLPEGPSALDGMSAPEFPEPLVDLTGILSGGPPPDGIPSIDDPVFLTVEEADAWLHDGEPVIVLALDGEAHVYPVQILIWHEIVNDTVGGVPVSVTYCPLCNSAVSYERRIDGVETTFGTSGLLYASALVMYDRATESLWTHYDGRAVVGMLAGHTLEPISSPLLSWADAKAAYPEARVLDRAATGYDRPYGTNPYTGYDNPEAVPFLFRGALDDRAAAMRRVVGVALEDEAAAWALDAISGGAAEATNTGLAGRPLVILWKAGQVSALDAGVISQGNDVGTVGVFDPEVSGEILTFSANDDGTFMDEQTGSVWDITGAAVAGELAGTRLDPIVHLDTFWFAWSTYRPGTALILP